MDVRVSNTWDMIMDSQGLIALFAVKVDLDRQLIIAKAALYHVSVDPDPDMSYLFLCPDFKAIIRLDPEYTFPGNLYVQEEGENDIRHPIVRCTVYKDYSHYLSLNPKNV